MASATRLSTRGFLPSLFQDPGIFAAPALGRVDHQRAALERDPGQAAGLYVDLFTVKRKRSQIDVTGFEPIFDDGRHTRQRQRGLCDVAAGVLADATEEIFALFGGGVRPDEHAVAPRPVRRL